MNLNEDIFGEKYAEQAKDYLLMVMVTSVIDGAMMDEFQQRVYQLNNPAADDISKLYGELYLEYGYAPYEGYEKEWMWIIHNFDQPFYYISYCVSALSALEIYRLSCESLEKGVDKYLSVCCVDTELFYFDELMAQIGMPDVFDSAGYSSIVKVVRDEMEN